MILTSQWYVLKNKYRKENSLFRILVDKGFNVYYPKIRVEPVNSRSKKERPYFPGYMFVFVDLKEVGVKTFQRMPYVIDLVNFGGEPAVVPNYVVDALQKKVDSQNLGMKTKKEFVVGEPVKVLEGPFTGYKGIFDKSLSGETRVRILLNLLHDKKIMLELSAADLAKY